MERFKSLLDRYVRQELTPGEYQEFRALLSDREECIVELERLMASTMEPKWDGSRDAEIVAAIYSVDKTLTIRSMHRGWIKYAAAIILLFGAGAYLYFNQSSKSPSLEQGPSVVSAVDVQPGGNKATLTLADGRTIVLDSAANGELAREGFSRITKKGNGEIEYVADRPGTNMAEVSNVLNTMRTPKGGEYQLVLPDGSRVWLNAASSITYPAVFMGRARKVTVTGEVYFEVAKKVNQPFEVTVNGITIQVLGTKFNVNAYGDETKLSATLLEGSVLVKNGIALENLQPGQQAQISRTGELEVVHNVNLEAVMAWKNGTIAFDNHSLETNLKQLARWYDLSISIEGRPSQVLLKGRLNKFEPLSSVLKGLSLMNLHARLEPGRRLIIVE